MGDSNGPTIVVKVLKADKVRTNARGDAPDPMVKLRINLGGSGAGEFFNSKTLRSTTEPSWNEEFTLPVKDPANSQLECSIWDQSDADGTPAQKFLGEVILNLAKLVPYNKSVIEQVFEIKQGKTHKATADDKKATGKLKLGLQLIIPDDAGSSAPPPAPAAKPAAPPPPKAQAPPPKAQAPPPPQPTTPKAVAPAPAPVSVSKQNEENVKPSMMRKARDPDLPKGMVPPPALPGQGKLFVTVHTVQNVPKSDAAYGAAPYPYVIIALEGATRAAQARTVTRDKEENPAYGEKEFVFGVDNQASEVARLHFKLFDWNRGKDDQLGAFMVNLADLTQQPLEQQPMNLTDPKRGGSQVTGTNGAPTRAVVSLRWSPSSGPPAPVQPKPAATPPAGAPVSPKSPPTADTGVTPGSAPRVIHGQNRAVAAQAPFGEADVGLVLSSENNKILVAQVMPGGPASNSNQIRVGDALIDVDGHDVVGRPVQEVQNMLQGERNSPITMIFRRGGGVGGEQVVVTLLRAGVAKALIAAAPNNAEASSAPGERSFLESMTGLKSEFSNLSFLWGEPINDAVHENMRDWKENMLYGPKREFPADPTPMPPGMMQDAPSLPSFNMAQPSVNDSHLGMRRSFNAVPAASAFPSNVPIYRSFDQGSISSFARSGQPTGSGGYVGQPMRMSESSLSMRLSTSSLPYTSNTTTGAVFLGSNLATVSGRTLSGLSSMQNFGASRPGYNEMVA